MKLVVKKALNNNVLLVNTPNHEKRIIMGAGLGWGIKPGDIVDSINEKIDQVFVVENQAYANTFEAFLERYWHKLDFQQQKLDQFSHCYYQQCHLA